MFVLCSLLLLGLGIGAQGAPPSRIIGGHSAPNHKYPYQVSLRDPEFGHYCSGSILNEHWILTAGHCIAEPAPTDYTISVGTNFLNVSGDVYVPKFSVIHEKYITFQFSDIGLIRVVGEIAFSDFVKPIILPNEELTDYDRPATIAGWGRLSTFGPMSNELQEIDLKVITVDECVLSHKLSTPDHICTFTKVDEGICFGDSGGPLVVGGVQVGIASYIIPCAEGYPDVFTRVWSYRDWIDSTIQRFENSSEPSLKPSNRIIY